MGFPFNNPNLFSRPLSIRNRNSTHQPYNQNTRTNLERLVGWVVHIHSVIFIACMFHCQSKAKERGIEREREGPRNSIIAFPCHPSTIIIIRSSSGRIQSFPRPLLLRPETTSSSSMSLSNSLRIPSAAAAAALTTDYEGNAIILQFD